jgi:hypothetical protein
VLLLHGVLCNAGAMRDLRNDLLARNIGPVYLMSYGPPLESIEHFADQVAAKIDAIRAATGASRVAILGHSMGGIVARRVSAPIRWEKGLDGDDAWHAAPRQRPRLALSGTSLAQLRQGNAWLAGLNRAEVAPDGVRLVSLWSWHDSMVAPQTSACLDGAENIALPGHRSTTRSCGIAGCYALVAAELTRPAGYQNLLGASASRLGYGSPAGTCPWAGTVPVNPLRDGRRPSARRGERLGLPGAPSCPAAALESGNMLNAVLSSNLGELGRDRVRRRRRRCRGAVAIRTGPVHDRVRPRDPRLPPATA